MLTGSQGLSKDRVSNLGLYPAPVLCKPKEISLKMSLFLSDSAGAGVPGGGAGTGAAAPCFPQETLLPAKSARDVSCSLGSQKEKP